MKRLIPGSTIWLIIQLVIVLVGIIILLIPTEGTVWELTQNAVGAGLVATGIAGMTLVFYIKHNETFTIGFNSFFQAGLTRIFQSRSVTIKPEYESRIKSAKKIDIIGFGLSSFRQDFLKSFANLSQTTKFRILLIDPDFPSRTKSYSRQRDKEEKNPDGDIKKDVKEFIDNVEAVEGLNKDNFKIRLTQILPAINIFRIDDEIFFGPYLIQKQSRNTITFLARKGGYLYETLSEHFETIWASEEFSKFVDLE